LEKAKRMLEDPNNNMIDISCECGFNSPAYFSTAFKNAFDVSPSKYRSEHIKQ
jgi:AraC-like DNA-binding protein